MNSIHKTIAAACLLCVVTVGVASPAVMASVAQPAVVSTNPIDTTPHIVLDTSGQNVYALAQVGRTMFAGGQFSQVQNPARTITYARRNFFAFDSDTGAVSPLNLSFDGQVSAIASAADGSAIFIGGSFKTVNGLAHRGLLKYDLIHNRFDPAFQPAAVAASVSDVKVFNGSLVVGGTFAKHLVALNQATGADTVYFNVNVAGSLLVNEVTRVRRIAISPDGHTLVATGNFTTVNGQPRPRAFELTMGYVVSLSSWHPPRLDVNCPAVTRNSAQGVDFSPDGSYFVIVASGAPNGTVGLCDAAARFETNRTGAVEPTWINWTGGDSLFSVAVTGAAVYVGGHQRWLDNPEGYDSAGPGAVSRPGLAAIDPSPLGGKALAWVDPTHSRNAGTMTLFATPCGLWAGSDGTVFGGEYHAGVGFVPLPDADGQTRTVPFSCVDTFVSQQYLDFTGRLPAAAEKAPLVAAITNGTKSADQVINEISHLAYVQKQAPIIRLYQSYFRRLPDRGGLDFYSTAYRAGSVSLDWVSAVFAGSGEFVRTYGSLNNSQFVQLVYRNVLGRAPSAKDAAYWVGRLNARYPRSSMMLFFSESSEHTNKTRNLVDVVITYRGMLQRMPNATELSSGESVIAAGGANGLNQFVSSVRLGATYANRFR